MRAPGVQKRRTSSSHASLSSHLLARSLGGWPGPPGIGCQSQSGLPQTQRPRRRIFYGVVPWFGLRAAPWGSGPRRRGAWPSLTGFWLPRSTGGRESAFTRASVNPSVSMRVRGQKIKPAVFGHAAAYTANTSDLTVHLSARKRPQPLRRARRRAARCEATKSQLTGRRRRAQP